MRRFSVTEMHIWALQRMRASGRVVRQRIAVRITRVDPIQRSLIGDLAQTFGDTEQPGGCADADRLTSTHRSAAESGYAVSRRRFL